MNSLNLFKLCLLLLPLTLSTPSFCVTNDNAMLNHIYQHFNTAFNTLDSQEMYFIYTEDAAYISDDQNKKIIFGRQDIIKQYRHFFKKINNKNASIEVDFRIIQRHTEKNNATDIGYYLIRYTPHKTDGEPVSEFAGKFVGVFKKYPNGHWYLVVETNNKADTRFYYNAKPQPNLYYGRQFTPIKSGLINTDD